MGHFKNIHIDQLNQEQLLEHLHNEFINKVTQSGIPLWMVEQYNASLLYESEKEVNNRNSAKTGESDGLPF